jgi:transcription antitermination protein NusB
MANRHLSRSIVLQTLFEWDFAVNKEELPRSILMRDIEEFGPGTNDREFIEALFDGVIIKQAVLNEIIEKAAPDWPLEKISVIDRNILRIGLYELLFGDRAQVPPKVAINEAIELAKSYGGENSSRFINGVLGGVYKELGEPGKDDTSHHKSKKVHGKTEIPEESKAGAVVYAYHDGVLAFAFVHDAFGYWTLAKGTVKDGEKPEETAKRKVKEELGLDVVVKDKLGCQEYIGNHPTNGKSKKCVTIFLAEAIYGGIKLTDKTKGLDGANWFNVDEIGELKMYDNVVGVLTGAIKILTNKND